ncbi:unnamed protein product [Rotaria magnacalcarata]|uniref:Uncharacterized protein n=1 Tax=Rotaria magnacalcarata TaxID=392030 RepID=A0A816ZFT2_9BILA|nr:unnamed protein product [Rotaria magnacalcarata]CAF1622349.1 unnamed protein product [Rotaria magnacalcarata]CAF2048846.1 unnamed protein product [Rotaria magnacalcarata]CAF2193804.1 unnamed protein product [Rotaria magnacalcarata]CAF3792659.1 unnamed protein product [Rotaria magnacalcarata]
MVHQICENHLKHLTPSKYIAQIIATLGMWVKEQQTAESLVTNDDMDESFDAVNVVASNTTDSRATSRAKGPVDGIGAVVKSCPTRYLVGGR